MNKIYNTDPWLEPYKGAIDARAERIRQLEQKLIGNAAPAAASQPSQPVSSEASSAGQPSEASSSHTQSNQAPRLADAVNNHLYYGLHKTDTGNWVFREWAPNATRMYLLGEFNNWKRTEAYRLMPTGGGNWEIKLPGMFLRHGQLYKLWIEWKGGAGERIPAYATRVVQDPNTKIFSAQVWSPEQEYIWQKPSPGKRQNPFIYECHIGMAGEAEQVSTFNDFRTTVLPKVKALGYDTLQIMALQEHPYYGSFGYQVSNFFALSSRFGTPEEFKALVDEAHSLGIAVIMDIVHSHAVSNEAEGLSCFDGREDLYFYPGAAGHHPAWGSRCFDYGKDEVNYFLLSNCKYWMQEYHLDGFRFDGVTSMLYWDHGLGTDFGDYSIYFGPGVDENAVNYLALANRLIRQINPDAITIAEDVSGMPGLAAPLEAGGVGFGFRMAMGIADHWIKWIKEKSDEQWSPGEIWYELTNKRADEQTISYAECHDQALVGDKTIIFRLIDKEMYWSMNKGSQNLLVDRGVALHKIIRLATAATAGGGYLNFMGNEFGHPEWIDFPREGNNWSYKYARRQWSLSENPNLRYAPLRNWDEDLIHFLKQNNILAEAPVLLRADEEKKILIFSRNNCIFALNFNPTQSFQNYGFEAPDGKWQMVFNSDEVRYDGFRRLPASESHIVSSQTLYLYLPCRCAIVLKKV